MKRWKKVTIWIASIVVILGVGGLFAANYAVDKVLDSMVGMSIDDLVEDDTGSEETSDQGNNGDASTNNSGDTDQATNGDTEAEGVEDDGDTSVTDGGSDPDQPVSNDNNGSSSGGGQSGTTGGGQSGSTGSGQGSDSKGGSSGYSAEVSTDKAKEVEENITVGEKAKVVTTLMSSLSASDISALQKLASGGLNIEEKREAKALLLEKLSEDQYNDLIAIAAKHGLSKGKSYSESIKE